MVGANAGSEIAVQRHAAQQGCMTIDVPALERGKLCEQARIPSQHARVIHDLRQTMRLRMRTQRQQVGDLERRTRRLKACGRHAGGQVHPDVHDCLRRAGQNPFDAGHPQNVGDLVRIGEHGRHAMRQNQPVELERGNERAFEMHMRVDEARHGKSAPPVQLDDAAIGGMCADNSVAHDGDVGAGAAAGYQVQ